MVKKLSRRASTLNLNLNLNLNLKVDHSAMRASVLRGTVISDTLLIHTRGSV